MFLKSEQINIGDRVYKISEFTALDRLAAIEHSITATAIQKPDEQASELELAQYELETEKRSLNHIAYSLALSLAHTEEMSTEQLVEMIQSEWPNAKVNLAYQMLVSINRPKNDQDDAEVETTEMAPEKHSNLLGRLRAILRLS